MTTFNDLPTEIQRKIWAYVFHDTDIMRGTHWRMRSMNRQLRQVPKPLYNRQSARLYNIPYNPAQHYRNLVAMGVPEEDAIGLLPF